MKYKFLEHTADVLFEAYGKTFEEALENAAEAMFLVIADVDKIEPTEQRTIRIIASDRENLVVKTLAELLTTSDIDNLFFKKFKINKIIQDGQIILKGVAYGEERNSQKGRTEVKAVTYHELAVKKIGQKWVIKILLDI